MYNMTNNTHLVIFTMNEKAHQIQIASIQLFEQFGYKKVSIDEIVQKANIAKGTFYLYFKNKEELYYSILEGFQEQGEQYMRTLAKTEPNLKVRLYKKLIGSLCFMTKRPILREIALGNPLYLAPEINRQKMLEVNLRMNKILLNKDLNQLRPDLSLEKLTIIQSFFMILIQEHQRLSDEDFWRYGDKLARVLIDGILSQSPWPEINYQDEIQQLSNYISLLNY